MPECTPLDHSDYKLGTNFWGLERVERRTHCKVCGKPEFYQWFQDLYWDARNPHYWKQIFKDADEQAAFFWKTEPNGLRVVVGVVAVDDEINDPASILIPTRPDWAKGDLSVVIKQERYKRRRKLPKENDYGEINEYLKRELDRLIVKHDLEYADNRRYAALDTRKDMRRYQNIKDHGCCGSFDTEVTIGGRKFMVGCNYGH